MSLPLPFRCLIPVVFLFSQSLLAKPASPDLAEFALSKIWLKALHYERTMGGSFESRIDDQRFFLAKNGKADPLAELTTFVRFVNEGRKVFERPVKCLMPYRYRIAVEHKIIEAETTNCDALEAFKGAIGLDLLSVVFVAQYADNPSSVLGHLFLQVSDLEKKVEGSPVNYVYKTINYAASVPRGTNILKYMAYGMFGGFTGHYSLYEYADMVEKYNNMEGRDLFAYELNLNSSDVERVVEHVYELLEISSHDYYFFDENCAYQILAIIEAVRPELELVAALPFYTTPIDVVKTLFSNKLVRKTRYTPSLYQRMLDKLTAMNSEQRGRFYSILSGSDTVANVRFPLLAEALVDGINFKTHEENGKKNPRLEELKRAVLERRASMPAQPSPPVATKKKSPHLSHGDARIALGAGHDLQRGFSRLHFRPAIHSLLSRHDGYQRNTSISILAFELRQYADDENVVVDHIELANFAKLIGTRLHNRWAWRFNFRLENTKRTCIFCLAPNLSAQFGTSQNLAIDVFDFFLLATAAYRPYVFDAAWHGGLGATVGFSYTPHDSVRAISFLSRLYNPDGEALDEFQLGANLDLTRDVDVQFQQNLLFLEGKRKLREYLLEGGYSF